MTPNPIARLRAKGDPFAIGAAIGRATAAGYHQRVRRTEQFRALDARWRGSDELRQLESAARAAYPDHLREIEGLAHGLDHDFGSVFLWNCRGDLRLPETVSAATRAVAATGCTSLLLPATGDGPAVIAHNEDGAADFAGACAWAEIEPDRGPAFASFLYPGMIPGNTFGLNAAGLVQTINNITPHDLKPGIPRQIVCRAILAAPGLDAALAILRRTDRASGFHHNLGEAPTRRLASAEAPASGCAVRVPTAPSAHANHLLAGQFAGLDQTVSASSRNRQQAADRMLARAASPEAILFDDTTPIHVHQPDSRTRTLATSLFALFPDRIEWCIHAAPHDRDTLAGTLHFP